LTSLFFILTGGLSLQSTAHQASIVIRGTIKTLDQSPLKGDISLVYYADGDLKVSTHQTDSQGYFAVGSEPGVTLVVAKASGHISAETELSGTESAELEFQLFPAGSVSGRVLDEQGKAVGFAKVLVRYPDENRRYNFRHEEGLVTGNGVRSFISSFHPWSRRR
jgi:hypothetical protein